ncbi:MAG: hypothetical protein R2723_03660 [Microbacterium sp.]
MDAAWDALAAIYPSAQIVILGPAPQVLPVEAATARIDRDLAGAAAARGWWYVSPIDEQWITPANYTDVIDTGAGRDHPPQLGTATSPSGWPRRSRPYAVIPSIGTPP